MEFIDTAEMKVIEALNVHDAGDSLAPSAVHRGGDGPGGIEAADEALHGAGDARAAVGALFGFFIAERPEDDAGMIAVAANHAFKLAEALGIRGQIGRAS